MKGFKKLATVFCSALCGGAFATAFASCEIGEPIPQKPQAGVPSLEGEEVFVYDESGKRVEQNDVMVEIDGAKYYVVANKIVKDSYQVVGNRVYYFGADGKSTNGAAGDEYTFGEDGYILGEFLEMQIGEKDYFVIEDSAYAATEVKGVIYESDNDYDMTNNDLLKNVTCSVEIAGHTFTVTTNDAGEFLFAKLPAMGITFEFTLDGYIQATLTVTSFENGQLKIVLDRNVSNTLSGKIVTANGGLAMEGATLTLKRTTSTNELEFTAVSDANGDYTFRGLTAGVYDLTVEKEGFITISQKVQVNYNETTLQNVTLEAISSEDKEKAGTASGTITDALTGNAVTVGLSVYIRKGINNFAGESIAKVTTDASGKFVTPELPVGNYTAYVVDERETLPDNDEDERYRPLTIALKVLADQEVSGHDATVSNNKGFAAGTGVRVVLRWGTTPGDLDSHLTFGSKHVYYSSKEVENCTLDVDDRNGEGPETVTIAAISDSYTYHYYVHNFSKSGTFSGANAVVTVYIGAKVYTYHAPVGNGYYWHIFTLNGATGEFVLNNSISSSESSW